MHNDKITISTLIAAGAVNFTWTGRDTWRAVITEHGRARRLEVTTSRCCVYKRYH